MALLLNLHKRNISKSSGDILKLCTAFVHKRPDIRDLMLKKIKENRNVNDLPIELENPFLPEKPQCILCKNKITPNFRNVRLLSQFVSSFTGRVYGRHITGLCKFKQNQVEQEIKKAQYSGLMGYYTKDINFLTDPDLYDPSKPFKVLD